MEEILINGKARLELTSPALRLVRHTAALHGLGRGSVFTLLTAAVHRRSAGSKYAAH